MPAPIFWKSKVILVKPETVYGTDSTPTGAADAVLMTNVTYSPMEGEDVSRDLEFPYLAAQSKIPVGLRVRLRGRVELQGSGTAGVQPAWGPLFRACGVGATEVADTSVTYSPISASMESVTLYFWVGNTLQVVTGARGTATLRFTAQGLPYMEFDVLGLYSEPTESAPATPTLSGFKKPLVVTNAHTPTFTIDDVSLVMRSLVLAFNSQVTPRLLVGFEGIVITDRQETITAQVEAVPVSTFNPFAMAGGDPVELELVHGTQAGSIITLNCPTVEIGRMGDYQQQDNVLEWQLPITPLPDSGNDQWTLQLT